MTEQGGNILLKSFNPYNTPHGDEQVVEFAAKEKNPV